MKELYNYRMSVSIDGEEYKDTSIWNHIKYLNPEEAKTRETVEMSFNEAYDIADAIMNAEKGITFFRKRRYIKFSFGSFFKPECLCLYEGTKKKIRVKEEYLPFSCSMESLVGLLNSEDFISYLKDRGISTYPMLKG